MMNIKIMQISLSYLFFMESSHHRSSLKRNSNVNYSPLKEHDDKEYFHSFMPNEKCFHLRSFLPSFASIMKLEIIKG